MTRAAPEFPATDPDLPLLRLARPEPEPSALALLEAEPLGPPEDLDSPEDLDEDEIPAAWLIAAAYPVHELAAAKWLRREDGREPGADVVELTRARERLKVGPKPCPGCGDPIYRLPLGEAEPTGVECGVRRKRGRSLALVLHRCPAETKGGSCVAG